MHVASPRGCAPRALLQIASPSRRPRFCRGRERALDEMVEKKLFAKRLELERKPNYSPGRRDHSALAAERLERLGDDRRRVEPRLGDHGLP
jgi:hypothetical protein